MVTCSRSVPGAQSILGHMPRPATHDLSPGAGSTRRVMALHGQSMTRAGSIFAVGLVAVVPFGVVSIAVTTRCLSTVEYGHLAVLFAVASIVTVFCGLGFLQGTMMTVYGIS